MDRMDRDDVIVGKILTRRSALAAAARTGFGFFVGGAVAGIARADSAPTTQPAVNLVATPELTEGPFFVDERLNRSNITTGTDRPTVIHGIPLLVGFTIYELTGKTLTPMKGAFIDVWHADAAGAYSDEGNPMNGENTAGQKWLRGYQVIDATGAATFQTIFPGWYSGRTPHIHFMIRKSIDGNTRSEFTSQLFFRPKDVERIYSNAPYSARGDRDTGNENDHVFNQRLPDGTVAGSHMLLDVGGNPSGAGFAGNFAVVLTSDSIRPQRHGFFGRPDGPPPDGGFPGGPPPDGPPPQ